MERKRARGDVRRRGLLQEFLPARCSQRCWLPVPADPAALTDCVPASPWQHNFQQLRSRSRTKEKSTARRQGPFPLKPTAATLATGEGCCWLADFGEKTARWAFATFKEPNAGKPLPPPRPKGPQPLRLRAARPAALPDASLPPRPLYRRPQINSKRFEIIIISL